jgi:hypothetical protein
MYNGQKLRRKKKLKMMMIWMVFKLTMMKMIVVMDLTRKWELILRMVMKLTVLDSKSWLNRLCI